MSTDYGVKYETTRGALFQLLRDGEWHPWRELRDTAGVRYGARLRELKREGFTIESAPSIDDHGKLYRMPDPRRGGPSRKRVKVYLDESDAALIVACGYVSPRASVAVEDALESFLFNKDKL